MFDLIRLAMFRAVQMYDGDHGDPIFSAACFSSAFTAMAGTKTPLDGNVVRAMLCGRGDVEILPGGAHFRALGVRPERKEAPSNV